MAPQIIHLELSSDDAGILRDVLQNKLHDLKIEINRTDHVEFKDRLRETERTLERLVRQLGA